MAERILQNTLLHSFAMFKDRVAIEYRGQSITYSELDRKSNYIAHLLVSRGMERETFVGILMENRLELLLSIMGIIKAGGVFTPLDPAFPESRLKDIIATTQMKWILGDTAHGERMFNGDTAAAGINYISTGNIFEVEDIEWLNNKPEVDYFPGDKSYIYCTSGTTGKPKAIVGKNEGLQHFIEWEIDTFGAGPGFRVSQLITPGFDPFLRDVFVPLCSGGVLCIPENRDILLDATRLVQWLEKSRVNLVHCVPTVFRLMNTHALNEGSLKSLMFILFCGEKTNPGDLVNWYNIFGERVQLVNLYGPTETTLAKLYYLIKKEDVLRERIPIGKPIKGARVVILDERMNICEELETGEIYIRTQYMSHGYYNDPRMNEEKFILNPFTKKPGDILYRTGDLGRLLPDGNIDILGRVDRQVKIRGQRIELEEIEAVLIKHGLAKEAVVVKRSVNNNEWLSAFLVLDETKNDRAPRESKLLTKEFSSYLWQLLPEYMIPSHFKVLKELPRKPNGKIDYDRLPVDEDFFMEYVPPADGIERKLVDIWSEVLNREKIGVTNRFAEMGGSSLNIMTLITKIHKVFDVRISLGEMFKNPTVRLQAAIIRESMKERFYAIEPVEKKEYYPVSSAQRRLYALQILDPDSTVYNLPEFHHMVGEADRDKLGEVFHQLIRQHESLRTSFHMINEQAVQRIHDECEFKLIVAESGVNNQKEQDLLKWFVRPFNLKRAPLLRVGIRPLESQGYLLVVDMHHLISDGVSHGLLVTDFLTLMRGEPLQELVIQYKDYTEWQQQKRDSGEAADLFIQQREYWLDELSDELTVIDLPLDFPRPQAQSFEGGLVPFEIGEELSHQLINLAAKQGCTLYMVILAAFNVFLAKLSRQDDIIMGTDIACRNHADLQTIIGLFVNTLVLRNYPGKEKSFDFFLGEVKERTLKAFENQDFLFEDLVVMLKLPRDVSRNPVFDVSFAFIDRQTVSGENHDTRLEYDYSVTRPVSQPPTGIFDFQDAKFDLTLNGFDSGDSLHFSFEYCQRLFKKETIQRWCNYFKAVLARITEEPGQKISAIAIISEKEKQEILFTFNRPGVPINREKTYAHLFEEVVERWPDRIAGVYGERQVTYQELNREGDCLAGFLTQQGVGKDRLVALFMNRNLEMLLSIIGVFKAGAAYLPIEVDYPLNRVEFMIENSEAAFLITDPARSFLQCSTPRLELAGKQPIRLVLPRGDIKPGTINHGNPDYLAYMIYTSGTTGRPKGVMIHQLGMINHLWAKINDLTVTARDILAQTASACFDISVWQFLAALVVGGTTVIIDKETVLEPQMFLKTVQQKGVTILESVPSLMSAFLEAGRQGQMNEGQQPLAQLRWMIPTGEALTPHLVRQWYACYPGIIMVNAYGPTEASDDITHYFIHDIPGENQITVPIGRPLQNLHIYILDESFHLCPVGVRGEICVAGIGVGKGYWKDKEKTARAFIGNPFVDDIGNLDYAVLYRTGDVGYFREDGLLECLGRVDDQVKIRGNRIELGEIQRCLLTHAQISAAAVMARRQPTGESFLCAYIVTRENIEIPVLELREYLGVILPDYMVPSYFVRLDELPVTVNGKLDRKALPMPDMQTITDVIPLANELEQKLGETWAQVLGVPVKNIGRDSNFFALGGDSIKAIQVSARLLNYGFTLPMRDMFLYPGLKEAARRIKRTERDIQQGIVSGEVRLTPIQLWFFEKGFSYPAHFNQAVMLFRPEGFDRVLVEKVFLVLVKHHDALRMVFRSEGMDGKVIIPWNRELEKPLFDLDEFDFEEEKDAEIGIRENASRIQGEINLSDGPLVKLGLFHTLEGDYLLIAIHHLVMDGVSWRILFADIEQLYQYYSQGNNRNDEPAPLPQKTDSFQLWADKLGVYARGPVFQKELHYWEQLEVSLNRGNCLTVPVDFPDGLNRYGDIETRAFLLSEPETEILLSGVQQAFGTDMNDILLTALGLAIKKVFKIERVAIAMEGHGRESIMENVDISRTVGWFTSLYPVILDFSSPRSSRSVLPVNGTVNEEYNQLARYIKEVKEYLHRLPGNGIGYGIWKYLYQSASETGNRAGLEEIPAIIFNYLGQFDKDVQETSFSVVGDLAGNAINPGNQRAFELEVTGMIAGKRLGMSILYSRDRFQTGTIDILASQFQQALSEIIAFCSSIQERQHTPVDFLYKQLTIDQVEQLSNLYAVEDIYPLSPMQEGMLFHSLKGGSSAYFEQAFYRLTGELDIRLVEQGINELMKRYDILRTLFLYETVDQPVQVVLKKQEVEFYYEDILETLGPGTSDVEMKSYLDSLKLKDRQRHFDLSQDVLMRVAILRTGVERYVFVWSFHHILMDGWCVGILIAEFFEIYASLKNNRPLGLPQPPPYRDYLEWLLKRDKNEARDYWKNYLDGYDSAAVLPRQTNYSADRVTRSIYKNETLRFPLEQEISDGLRHMAAKSNITLNILVQTLWGILLAGYNNTRDVVFGSVVSGRPAEIEQVEIMVGLFINTVPVRIAYNEHDSFTTLFQEIQGDAVNSTPYHYFPLADIQNDTPLKRGLFDHIFVFENYPVARHIESLVDHENDSNQSLQVELADAEIFEQTNYDLNLVVFPDEQLILQFAYNAHEFGREFLLGILYRFQRLCQEMIAVPQRLISGISLVSEEEKHRLVVEWNNTRSDYPVDLAIHNLFVAQARQTPDHIALVGPGGNDFLTYQQLHEASDMLALELENLLAGQIPIVALLIEPSTWMIISILGILKTGAAYLPIDPEYPAERIQYLLLDSGASILATSRSLYSRFQEQLHGLSSIRLFFPGEERSSRSIRQGHVKKVSARDLCYIIYTSGSTGRPKGVAVEHRGLVNYAWWAVQTYVKSYEKPGHLTLMNFPLYSSIAFDLTVTSIFTPLVSGNAIAIYKVANRGEFILQRIVEENRVDVVKLTPAHLKMLREIQLHGSTIRCLVVGGEALENQLAMDIYQGFSSPVDIYNEYGPTETVVGCMIYKFKPGGEKALFVSIGGPVANTCVYVVDQAMGLVPVGAVGELCIAGNGVARGYLNRPDITGEKFIKNPFTRGERMYKSGDLARWNENGMMDFLGRIDRQVKIRGFRIELGEIESRLAAHPCIKDVLLIDYQAGQQGDTYLCAYFTVNINDETGTIPDSQSLREYLSGSLPDYMIPGHFMLIEKIPLTANGKIDRQSLPLPVISRTPGEYLAPESPIEEILAGIWSGLLEIDQREISSHSNFFDLGGHSLKATLLISRIHKYFDVRLPMEDIFSKPTLRAMSRAIASASRVLYTNIQPIEKQEYYPQSSAQKRLFTLSQYENVGTSYNMPSVFKVKGNLEKERYYKTIQALVNRHETLRTTFTVLASQPVQVVYDKVNIQVEEFHLESGEADIKPFIDRFIRPFDLNVPPLFRVGLLSVASEDYYWLLFDVHHIVSDGTSTEIIAYDFFSLINDIPLPPLVVQYKDFSWWQNELLDSGILKIQEDYWLDVFSGEIPVLNLPTDFSRQKRGSFKGDVFSFKLVGEDMKKFTRLNTTYGVTLYMNLLAALNILLHKYTGQDDIVIGSAVAGRMHADLQPIIGMFVNVLAMRNYPAPDKTYEMFLKEVRVNCLKAFENQDMQFERLVERLNLEIDPTRHPLYTVDLTVQNFDFPRQDVKDMTIELYPIEEKTSMLDMNIFALQDKDEVLFSIQYCVELFKRETIERFADDFLKVMRCVGQDNQVETRNIELIGERQKSEIVSTIKKDKELFDRLEGEDFNEIF